MPDALSALIDTLKAQVTFKELRKAESAYLEGVVMREHLPACEALLAAALGPAAKPLGQAPALPRAVKGAIDKLGGVRQDQGLYFKTGEGKAATYAMLWPWGSDPNRVTVKVGTCTL